jgi:hypothetical protein
MLNPAGTTKLYFDRGTLVFSGLGATDEPPVAKHWKWSEEAGHWHTDAFRYREFSLQVIESPHLVQKKCEVLG